MRNRHDKMGDGAFPTRSEARRPVSHVGGRGWSTSLRHSKFSHHKSDDDSTARAARSAMDALPRKWPAPARFASSE